MSTDRHGDGSRASAALWAVEGRGQALTSPQQQLSRTEVTRHWWGASLHHPSVSMIVVRAAEGAAEQISSSLPPVTVISKYEQNKSINNIMSRATHHFFIYCQENRKQAQRSTETCPNINVNTVYKIKTAEDAEDLEVWSVLNSKEVS